MNYEPKQDRAIKTKKLILETAFHCFLKHGYKKTTTNLIATHSKTSIGNVYSYFQNKEELFDLWLNTLLEKSDSYFYNQFKLLEYDVELELIIENILDKLSDVFFSSPVLEEKGAYVSQKLHQFLLQGEKIFIKCSNDANIFIHHQSEITHVLIQLVIAYNKDLKNKKLTGSASLKKAYIAAIAAILNN